ncbi:hypothetical protein [Catellatospora sp. NPDC049133]|uniref:hypothetical protein n=1 Tax=Catellatospora sp. NPDC049133 TaxID=3155499 RepID=UPI00340CAB76
MRDETGRHRVALEESSLDFRSLDAGTLENRLEDLSDTFALVSSAGHSVVVHPWLWSDVECLDGVPIHAFLFGQSPVRVSRDVKLRLAAHLDRSPMWPDTAEGGVDKIRLTRADAGVPPIDIDIALSLGVAAADPRIEHLALLAFGDPARGEWWKIEGPSGSANAFRFGDARRLVTFWRYLFEAEDVPEADFFSICVPAFPDLIFHDDLRFGRFDGDYLGIRSKVVSILGALNDHFSRLVVEHSGVPSGVSAAFGSHGVDLSPESSKTRSSSKLMALRTVQFEGEAVSVEWHAKLEPHRNRIHFSLPMGHREGRILIGIFVDHLPT